MREIPEHAAATHARNVGSEIYGAARLELAKHVKTALEHEGLVWFLDGGTLLGAYRDGKQIAHDDDFDIAASLPDFKGEEDLIALQHAMAPLLPAPYEIRIVTSYASKLEIYDSTSELYALPMEQYRGADFHTVTVDVQVMTNGPDGFMVYLHELLNHIRVPKDSIEPTGRIVCDGTSFNCPNHPAQFLESQYGYIGVDAHYDAKTKMYVKDESGVASSTIR